VIAKTTVNNLIILLINFITSILAARVLGSEGRGELALILLYPQIIATMGLLGLDRSLAITSGNSRLNSPIKAIAILVLFFIFPIMWVSYFAIISNVSDARLVELSLIYILYTPAVLVFMLSGSVFNGLGMFFEYNMSRLSFYGSYLMLIIVLLMFDVGDLEVFVYSSLLSVYIAMAVSLIFMLIARRHGKINEKVWKLSYTIEDIRVIFKKALLFIVPGVLMVASGRIDQVIVSNYLDLKFLGLFVVYMAYTQLIAPFSNAINIKIFHNGITGIGKNITIFVRMSVFLYANVSVFLILLAPFFISILYGSSYLEYIDSARLLVLSAFFMACSKIFSEYMMGRSMANQNLVSSVLFMSSLVFFSYFLIPTMSITGMAISMIGASAVQFTFLVIKLHAVLDVSINNLLFVNRRDLIWTTLSLKKIYKQKW
jgi:enterobacterial common antigen flippase